MLGQRSIFVCVLLVTGIFIGGCSATPQLKSVPEVQKQIESKPPAPASTSHADIYAKETGLKNGLMFAQWNINMSAAEKAGRITAATTADRISKVSFEKAGDSGLDCYSFEISQRAWTLSKAEVKSSGEETLRSRYELTKSDA